MGRAQRLRGVLLRLVLDRRKATAVGLAIASPAVWVLVGDYAWESGATDGVAMIALATGVALAWAGVTGRRPDWR
ncbi:MAG: hypothetical protein ACRD26_02450 [Vicinamibacterales bacterium]